MPLHALIRTQKICFSLVIKSVLQLHLIRFNVTMWLQKRNILGLICCQINLWYWVFFTSRKSSLYTGSVAGYMKTSEQNLKCSLCTDLLSGLSCNSEIFNLGSQTCKFASCSFYGGEVQLLNFFKDSMFLSVIFMIHRPENSQLLLSLNLSLTLCH